jgi:heavy metal efflux system protein
MIASIIRFAVRHRLLVLLLIAILVGAGVYSLGRLPIDAVPDVTNVQVQVLTAAPSLAPLEIERQITFPVEVAMSGLPGIEEIRSVSKFGLSAVTVVFEDSTDIYFARQLVLERLSVAREQIPESIGSPEMGPISTGLGEIYQYEIVAEPGSGYDATSLRTVQDWIVRRQLLGVEGVTEVNSFGGREKQYQVRIDPARLQAYDLTLRDVLGAVTRNNANVGGAYIEHGEEQYLLRGIGLAESAEDVANIVVKTGPEGVPVYVRDLGEVVVGSTVRQGAVTADGEGEIVAGIAMMLKGENSRTVVERVKERVEQIKKTLPKGVELVPFYDRTELVDRTIRTVVTNLVEGAALVIFVLILLLGNWRGALLVATIIPLSMLFAAICMVAFGVSGNLMSLGALDFGLIVDGAVVMVENAVRRRAEARHEGKGDGPERTILDACVEVGRPVVFAVAIIMIVYLPILSLRGIEGKMFIPMALTVVFALAGSLLLSLTYVPAALTFVLRGPDARGAETESPVIRSAKRWYRPALNWTMGRRAPVAATALALVVLSAVTLPLLGSEFIPRLDEGSLAIQVQQLPSVSLTQSIETVSRVERVVRSFPEVTKVVSKTGRAEVATDPMSIDFSDLYIGLKPRDEWTTADTREGLVEAMSEALEKKVPAASISFSQPIELRVSELISGVRSDVGIKLFGDDLETLKERADEIARVVGRIEGAEDVKAETVSGLPQLQIKPDRAAIARYGLNVEDVNDMVESIVVGKDAGQIYEGEQRFGIVVRFAEMAEENVEAIRSLTLVAPNGSRVPLGQVADIALVEGAAQISREDTRRRIAVEFNVRGRDIGSFVREAQGAIEREVDLPPGYYLTWGGQFENLRRATETLLVVVPLALFLIFVMLFTTFGSVRQALLIYTGIPFAVVGGVFALALRGMPFSISAGVGFIALFGVAVLNGVVMVSSINRLREEGRSIADAVAEGAETRLRPVLMTALVAALGFVPMALAGSAGAEVQRPLATVVIGGVITSTILTLLLLPTLYQWFERERAAYEPSGAPRLDEGTEARA